jgi:hypothetical protein
MNNKNIYKIYVVVSKAVASIAVCALGGYCLYITNGNTGIGWAILGLLLIWE